MSASFRPSIPLQRRRRPWRVIAITVPLVAAGLWIWSRTSEPTSETAVASTLPIPAAPGHVPLSVPRPAAVKTTAEPVAIVQPTAPEAAALVQVAAVASQPEPPSDEHSLSLSLSASPNTIDSTSFSVNGATYHLGGVRPVEAWRICPADASTRWPCGAKALAAFKDMIANSVLTCRPTGGPSTTGLTVTCTKDGQDVATALVKGGWAVPAATAATDGAEALAQAKKDHAGIWLYVAAEALPSDSTKPASPGKSSKKHHRKHY